MTFTFHTTIEHDLMPMPRLSHGKRTARDNRYFANRNELAWQLMSERKGIAIDRPCSISFAIHLPHKRKADIDNLLKTLLDALVYGGVIKDDSLVTHIADGWVWRGATKGVVMVGVAPLELPPKKANRLRAVPSPGSSCDSPCTPSSS